jgi:hypothetical protein
MRVFTLISQAVIMLGLFSLAACNSKPSAVDIKTSGIFIPLTFSIDKQDASGKFLDMGEWVTSDGPKALTVEVQNKTFFPYADINLTMVSMNPELTSSMRFKPNNLGGAVFPGAGGTCLETLGPGLSCTIIIEFSPLSDGRYEESVQLSFKNWVNSESHQATLGFVSGDPAELIFDGTPSKISFGARVGSNYLVERTVAKTYDLQDPMFSSLIPKGFIEVKNVGGLAARDIYTEFEDKCSDNFGSTCADDVTYGKAFSYVLTPSGCGTTLRPGEICRIDLFYNPKNNLEVGLPSRFERIKYEGKLALKYVRRPDGQRQTLGLSMESTSSKIEGFIASNPTLDLTNSGAGVIQGNESSKKIRIENIGFTKVRLKKIILTKAQMSGSGDEVWGICERVSSSSPFLSCYKPNSTILYSNLVGQFELLSTTPARTLVTGPGASSYEALPIIVEDLGQGAANDPGCFAPEAGPNKAPLVDINGGCFLNVIFRPTTKTFFIENPIQGSVASVDAADSSYSVLNKPIKAFVVYDSQWKYGEDHCQLSPSSNLCPGGILKSKWYKTDFSFEILAKRRPAAKLVVQNIQYNNNGLDFVTDAWTQSLGNAWNANGSFSVQPEGRVELLAYNQRNRPALFKTITINLANIGGARATLETPFDNSLGLSWVGKGSQTFSFDGQSVLANLQDANNCLSSNNECFYRNLSTYFTDCRKIEPGSMCTLTISYAPFSLGGDSVLQGKANYDDYPTGSIPSWTNLSSYNIGDHVTYNGLIYKALRTHGISGIFNFIDWEPLHKSFTFRYRNSLHKNDSEPVLELNDWAQLKQYEVYDEVIYERIRFKAKQNHTSGVTFDSSKWEINDNSIAETSFKIRTKLISVGKLEEMADNFYNNKLRSILTPLVKTAEMTFRYWFTNIGAGQVSHINLAEVTTLLNGTPDCGADFTEGGTGGMVGKDCRCYSASTPLTASTSCTSGAAASDVLASEQSCYLPLKWNLWMDEVPTFPVQTLTHAATDIDKVNYVVPFSTVNSKDINSTLSYKNCYTKSNNESAVNYEANWGYLLNQPRFTSNITQMPFPSILVPKLIYAPTSPWHAMGMGRRMGNFIKPDTTPNPFDPRFFYWDTATSNLWSLSHGSGSQSATPSHTVSNLLHSVIGSVNYFNPGLRAASSSSYDSINDAIHEATDDGAISYYLFIGKFAKYSQVTPTAKILSSFLLFNVGSTVGSINSVVVEDIPNTFGGASLVIKDNSGIVQSNSAYNYSLAGPLRQFSVEIDPTSCVSGLCVYSKSIDFSYDKGLFHKDWNGSTFVDATQRPGNYEKKIRVVLIAEIDSATTQPVLITHGDYQGETANVCPQTFQNFTVNARDWNQSAGQSLFTDLTLRTEKTKRVQKAIRFKNNTSKTIKLSNILMRFTSNSGNTAMISASDLSYWGISLLPTTTDGGNCNYTRCSVGLTLTPGQECYNVVRFNPTVDTTGSGKNYYLTYVIKENSATADKPHELLNLPLNFATISPARLGPYIVNVATESLLSSSLSPYFQNLSGWGLERNPYRIDIPSVTFQGKVSNGLGGFEYPVSKKYFRIKYLTTTDAKSSFLAQYRDLVNNSSALPHPDNNFVEDTSTDDGAGSLSYILIWEKNLNSTNHGLIKVFASRQCIYGNNPPVPDGLGVVVDNGSGFDRNETNCWVRVELTHNHKNLLHQTHFGSSANATTSTISPFLAQLRFYSVGRTSISSMSMVAVFTSRPKVVALNSKIWSAISAANISGSANLTELAAQITLSQSADEISNFGQVVGYRLIRSNASNKLSNTVSQGSSVSLQSPEIFTLKPAKPGGLNNNIFASEDSLSSVTNPVIRFNNATANRVYHYKLMAIVSHPNFTSGISMFGLSSNNHFLAATDLEVAKVITPNANYIYNHKLKALIQKFDVTKFANNSNKKQFTAAKNECSAIPLTISQDVAPTSSTRNNQLINKAIWDILPIDEITNDYWIDTTAAIPFNDPVCGGFPEYAITSSSLKCRVAINSTASGGRMLIGDLTSRNLYPYAPVGEYVIEDHSSLNWGFSRCFINLDTFVSPSVP